ncbi:hypothetical protein, partial [Metabacillus fastidiosus]|uniref:hypothetical protein n=1 Tax=Metabacillus fastidiosus TaxID=1458 RepID=UPI003D286C0A
KQDRVQDQSMIFYATFNINLPEPEWMNGEHKYAWEKYLSYLDKIKELHFEQLKTIPEISEQLKIPDWIIRDLFKANKVDKLSFRELSKRKRERDFDFLYDLHFNKKISLNDIYRLHGYSPLYVKRVFEDKGLSHLGFVNQLDCPSKNREDGRGEV